MLTKKPPLKSYVKYHNDGSIWAQGQMAGRVMQAMLEMKKIDLAALEQAAQA